MAYNNPKYAYWYREPKSNKIWKNKPKIDLLTRSMVYLRATNNLIIFDRVNSLDASYRKAWLTHFQGKPEISGGNLIASQVPGHIEDFKGGIVQATWGDGVLRPPDPSDFGRLFIKTFLPRNYVIRRIGGDGYEQWANGKNRTGDGDKLLNKLDAGRWRIEISPAEPQKFDLFLHLIHICDTKTGAMPEASLVEAETENMAGISIGGWTVLFGKMGQVRGEVVYQAQKGKSEHLIADLIPETYYKVTGVDDAIKRVKASAEGLLRFASSRAGTIRIQTTE